MHEMSLMNDLMSKIKTIAATENASQVTQVNIKLGALAHISADHFREHFKEASKGTPAERATLKITESNDISDPTAQDITLLSVDISEP